MGGVTIASWSSKGGVNKKRSCPCAKGEPLLPTDLCRVGGRGGGGGVSMGGSAGGAFTLGRDKVQDSQACLRE